MEGGIIVQPFEMRETVLVYEPMKSILVCKESSGERKKLWVKKLLEGSVVLGAVEDDARYYVALQSGDASGQFMALERASGATSWFIPGRAFLQILFDCFLYLIFIDERERYFLLKVDPGSGSAVWHYSVEADLCEYSFTKKRVYLHYASGRREAVSLESGRRESAY